MARAASIAKQLQPANSDVLIDDPVGAHGTKAITRAMLVLRLLAAHEIFGVRLIDLSKLTGIPHPTIRRLLMCLIDERLVAQDPLTRRYRLGPLNFELGLATLHDPKYFERFHPLLTRLVNLSGDATYLVVRSGSEAVCLDRVPGPFPPETTTLEVGGRRPLGFGAASIALLAECSDEEVEKILSINERVMHASSPGSADRIRRRVARAREAGYAGTNDMGTTWIRSIGMVIPSETGRSRFAVAICGRKEQFTPEHEQNVFAMMRTEISAHSNLNNWPF